jgi:hypothetical protein
MGRKRSLDDSHYEEVDDSFDSSHLYISTRLSLLVDSDGVLTHLGNDFTGNSVLGEFDILSSITWKHLSPLTISSEKMDQLYVAIFHG